MPLLSDPVEFGTHREKKSEVHDWVMSPWGGMDVRFLNGVLDKIVLNLREDHRGGVFPGAETLVPGVDLRGVERDRLVDVFGEPAPRIRGRWSSTPARTTSGSGW